MARRKRKSLKRTMKDVGEAMEFVSKRAALHPLGKNFKVGAGGVEVSLDPHPDYLLVHFSAGSWTWTSYYPAAKTALGRSMLKGVTARGKRGHRYQPGPVGTTLVYSAHHKKGLDPQTVAAAIVSDEEYSALLSISAVEEWDGKSWINLETNHVICDGLTAEAIARAIEHGGKHLGLKVADWWTG